MASRMIVDQILERAAAYCLRNYHQQQIDAVAEQWADAFRCTDAEALQAAVYAWQANLGDRAPVALPTVPMIARILGHTTAPVHSGRRVWRKPDPTFIASHREFQRFAMGMIGRELDEGEREQLNLRRDMLPQATVPADGSDCCLGGMVTFGEMSGRGCEVAPCRICEPEMFHRWFGSSVPEGRDGKQLAAGK